MSLQIRLGVFGILFAALVAAPATAAVTPATGWAVHSISTPGSVQGGVVRSGSTIIVGQGSFGAGTMRVIRIDGGGATTIATGFNALGGFALDGAGTLFVVDNAGDLAGAATGDTVFAIPDALTRTTALPALGAEVVPAGTIPAAADVALDGKDLIVSDAGGPNAGRVVRVAKGGATPIITTGLDYTAGVLVDGTRLLVGNSDASFVGSVIEYTLAGTLVGPVVGSLAGSYDHVLDNAGNLLVSGSSSVVAVAPGGGTTNRATGFIFSTGMFHDSVRDETLVLDIGTSIVAICRDDDTDTVCNADEACVGGTTIASPKLILKKQGTPAGDDGLKLTGEMTIPTVPAINPATNGVRIVVEDTRGTVAFAVIPGGAAWKVNPAGTVWKYVDPVGIAGIVKVVVKTVPATPGLVKFTVIGRKSAFATLPANLPLQATFMLNAAGQCGDVSFAASACAFNGRETTVKCE
jgi:hypothetical protein